MSYCLTIRSLEEKMRVRYLKLPDESGLDDLLTQFLYVVGLDLEPNGSKAPQELALISDISIEKPDVEVLAQANEVPFGLRFHDLATEDIRIELTNALSSWQRN